MSISKTERNERNDLYFTKAIAVIAKNHIIHKDDSQLSSMLNSAVEDCDLLCPPEIEDNLASSHNKDEYFNIFDDEQIMERIKENGFAEEYRTQAFHAFRADVQEAFIEIMREVHHEKFWRKQLSSAIAAKFAIKNLIDALSEAEYDNEARISLNKALPAAIDCIEQSSDMIKEINIRTHS